MAEKKDPTVQVGDRPIEESSQDRFRRQSFADSLARQILALPAEDSHVVGLEGAWGSGKTSIINLAAAILKVNGVAVVHFNPWLFSTAEQLTTSFFREVAAQLAAKDDKKWQSIGKRFEGYGEQLSPFKKLPIIGEYLGHAESVAKFVGETATKLGGGLTGSVYEQRKKIETALREAAQRS